MHAHFPCILQSVYVTIVNISLFFSHLNAPTNAEEAMRLQTENLEAASQSKGSSRIISRTGSRRQSGSNSAFGSGMQTPSGISTPYLHTAGQSAAGTRWVPHFP